MTIPSVTAVLWPGEGEQETLPSFRPCVGCGNGAEWLLSIPMLKRDIHEYYCDNCITKLPALMRRYLHGGKK